MQGPGRRGTEADQRADRCHGGEWTGDDPRAGGRDDRSEHPGRAGARDLAEEVAGAAAGAGRPLSAAPRFSARTDSRQD